MKNLRHRSVIQASAWRELLSRPWLSISTPVHLVILPDSLAEVELMLKGWGWLRIRPADAPRFIPTTRRFFWGRTTLQLTIPVGDIIALSAMNIWGRKRVNFSIAATSSIAPKAACLPEFSLPSVMKQISISQSNLAVRPNIKVALFHDCGLPADRVYRQLRSLTPITGSPAQLPEGVKRALHELNSDLS